jgi:hypothetical protein
VNACFPPVPVVGEILTGVVGLLVKFKPLLATPPTVTTTFPVVTPAGTVTAILVLPQVVGVAAAPLNATVLVPCVAPKPLPAMVIDAPGAPDVAERLVIAGATVKTKLLLATAPTVTTTLPVVAPAGTGTTMLVSLHVVGVAAVPLNLIVLVPCVAPNATPVTVIDAPIGPEVCERVVIDGATVYVSRLSHCELKAVGASCAFMYTVFAPTKVDLNVNARVRVRLLPVPEADDAPVSSVHCEFETLPGCPRATAGRKPTPLSLFIWNVLLLRK